MDEIKSSKFIEQGWQCPVCGAVMSPRERVCINCTGISSFKITNFDTGRYTQPSYNTAISSNMQAHFNDLDEAFTKFAKNKEGL